MSRRPTAADRERSRRSSARHRALVAAGLERFYLTRWAVELLLQSGGWITASDSDNREMLEQALDRMILQAASEIDDGA